MELFKLFVLFPDVWIILMRLKIPQKEISIEIASYDRLKNRIFDKKVASYASGIVNILA